MYKTRNIHLQFISQVAYETETKNKKCKTAQRKKNTMYSHTNV